ncbi:MAG: regulatory protein RecX [Campylobacterota bacterium]|nr:regulatory protein RecX [Campylobacterota bacterium]
MSERDDVRKDALKMLERKDYTERKLRDKLIKKEFSQLVIDDAMRWLKQKKFIDDRRFAENLVFFKQKKGYGKRRIIRDLFLRGVDEDIAQNAVGVIDFNEQVEKAKEILQKKEKMVKTKQKALLRKKLLQYLLQRGFEWEVVQEVWKRREEKDEIL